MSLPETADDAAVGDLLRLALEPPGTFADYLKLEVLGRGATSVVYRARRRGDARDVALKIMVNADAATQAERLRFLAGTAAAAALEHRNIVGVLDFGEHDQVPFVVMTLVEGEDLRARLRRARPSPAEAVRWMVRIARAIQRAHDEGILHRDLKPANILLDRDEEPYVADFGIARRLDQQGGGSTGTAPGTLCYMAPEQILRGLGLLTPAADIWGLGVIFYELLTHEVPFWSGSLGEMVEAIRGDDPVPPRQLNPAIPAALENVCLKCLEKAPGRRYASAAALADDLERALRGEPTIARTPSLAARASRWARRHPRKSVGIVATLSLAIVTTVLTLAVWRAQAREQCRVLDRNAFIASGQAGAVLFRLREYADRLDRVAQMPAVTELLSANRTVDPAPMLEPLAEGFDSLFVATVEGRPLALWPSLSPATFGRTYAFRDYFRAARTLADTGTRGVYLSRAFRSESHGVLEFAFSTPIVREGRWVGLVVATIRARDGLGGVPMAQDGPEVERITTALLGPRDNERATGDGPPPSDFTFLVHPGLNRGDEVALQAPAPARLREALGPSAPAGEQFALRFAPAFKVANFRDPIPGFGGAYLAAFAPVGKTGFIVLVETRQDVTWHAPEWLTRDPSLTGRRALVVAGPVVGLVAAFAGWRWRSRRRRASSVA